MTKQTQELDPKMGPNDFKFSKKNHGKLCLPGIYNYGPPYYQPFQVNFCGDS
jgi:hypothetical protein